MDVSPVGTHPRTPRADENAKCTRMQRYGLKGESFTYILHHKRLVIEVDQIGDRTGVGLFNPTTLTITTSGWRPGPVAIGPGSDHSGTQRQPGALVSHPGSLGVTAHCAALVRRVVSGRSLGCRYCSDRCWRAHRQRYLGGFRWGAGDSAPESPLQDTAVLGTSQEVDRLTSTEGTHYAT